MVEARLKEAVFTVVRIAWLRAYSDTVLGSMVGQINMGDDGDSRAPAFLSKVRYALGRALVGEMPMRVTIVGRSQHMGGEPIHVIQVKVEAEPWEGDANIYHFTAYVDGETGELMRFE